MTTRPTRRLGFTLIELLTVIAIIAVLAALATGAFFKVRASQQERLAGDTLTKLQKSMLQQWTAVLDNAKKEPVPDVVKAYCQNDPDRAAAVWAYLHLRKNFPETFDEARSAVVLPAAPPAFPTATVIFPAQQVFLNRFPKPSTGAGQVPSTLTADEQAAACFYVSLTEINRRGMESGITDNLVTQLRDKNPQLPVAAPPTFPEYKVFTDTFGQPISFRRFLSNSEMQAMPFAKPGIANRDPLDPLGKLATLPVAPLNLKGALEAAVGGSRVFNNTNFMPTVFSYGLNKKLDFSGTEPIGDDILGYRLGTEGKLN